jgi:hypothetical protein
MAEEDVEGRRDVVTDVEETGWLSRLGQSFAGGLVAYGVIRVARQRKQRKVAAA